MDKCLQRSFVAFLKMNKCLNSQNFVAPIVWSVQSIKWKNTVHTTFVTFSKMNKSFIYHKFAALIVWQVKKIK